MFGQPKVPFRQRHRTSRQIFGEALHLVRAERDLWRFPILAGTLFVAMMALVALAIGLANATGAFDRFGALAPLALVVAMMVLALPIGFLTALLNSAYAFGLHERLGGHDVSAAAAWARARTHAGTIFRFSVVAALVGGVLALLGQLLDKLRLVPFLGAAMQAVGAYAWAVAAFFVIPIIVVEREANALAALRASVGLARDTWGRSTAGIVTISLVLMVPMLVITVLMLGIAMPALMLGTFGVIPKAVGLTIFVGMMVVLVLGMAVTMTLSHATQTAYQVALFRTVRTGNVPLPFTPETIVDAWAPYRK